MTEIWSDSNIENVKTEIKRLTRELILIPKRENILHDWRIIQQLEEKCKALENPPSRVFHRIIEITEYVRPYIVRFQIIEAFVIATESKLIPNGLLCLPDDVLKIIFKACLQTTIYIGTKCVPTMMLVCKKFATYHFNRHYIIIYADGFNYDNLCNPKLWIPLTTPMLYIRYQSVCNKYNIHNMYTFLNRCAAKTLVFSINDLHKISLDLKALFDIYELTSNLHAPIIFNVDPHEKINQDFIVSLRLLLNIVNIQSIMIQKTIYIGKNSPEEEEAIADFYNLINDEQYKGKIIYE